MREAGDKEKQINIKPTKLNSSNVYGVVRDVVEGLDRDTACAQINKYIIKRLRLFKGTNERRILYFVAEKEYVETEWKDMVSMHYINTSYSFKNTVECYL